MATSHVYMIQCGGLAWSCKWTNFLQSEVKLNLWPHAKSFSGYHGKTCWVTTVKSPCSRSTMASFE